MSNLVPVNKSSISKKINSDSFFGKKAKVGKSGTEKSKPKGDSLRTEFILIRKKVIKIDKLLNAFIKFQKKNQEGTRRTKELDKRSEKENKLEKKKDKVGGISFPSLPVGGNFLEAIKKFLFFTFLNIALPKLLELLPKLRELGKAIAPATKFLLDIVGGIGKGLLSGLVNFIDWGYKIRDNTEQTIKQIGGDKAAKDFNEFNKRLNTFIDLSILAGLTALDVGLDAERFRKKQLKDQQKPKGRKPQVTEGRGGNKNLGRAATVTKGRGVQGGTGKPGSGRRVTQGRGVEGGGKPPSWWDNIFKGPFAKLKGPLSKFAGAAVPGLGAAVGAADATARFKSGDNVGGTLASVSATLDALSAGSAILALTGVGAAVPAAFGLVSMGIDVLLLIRDILKIFGVPMFSKGGKIKLLAQGGRIGTPGRTIKAQRKTFGKKISKQEINPGKDVGGKKQILKLFPDTSLQNKQQTISASPWWSKLFGNNQQQNSSSSEKAPNPYKALKGTAEILNRISGPIGRLMASGSMIQLGQVPDTKGFGSFVGKMTQDIIDNNINLSIGDIIKSISGFANGGDIRNQNIMKNNDIGYQVGQVVERAIDSMVSSKVKEAISSIQREISVIGKPKDENEPPSGGGNIIVSSDQPDFWLLATAALFEGISPQGYADVAQAIYNRVAMPGDPWKTGGSIRTAILNPTQFQPVRERGGVAAWSRITDKQSAITYTQSQGRTQAQLETAAAALLDTNRQRSAKTFVGPRDSFRSYDYENKNNHLADDTEVRREGHAFGFEPRGATIGKFRAGQLRPAEIDKQIITGMVTEGVGNISGHSLQAPNGKVIRNYSDLPPHHDYQRTSDGRIVQDFTIFKGNQYNNIPVLSPVNGVVVFSGWAGNGGNWVEIRSDSGAKIEMGHFNSLKVKKDDRVIAYKTVIGLQGSTGRSSGVHLHIAAPENILKNYVNALSGSGTPKITQKPSSEVDLLKLQKPTKKILKSFKAGGRTYTEREGGTYTENGKPITKDLYDAVLRNQRTDASQVSLAPKQPKSFDLAYTPSYQDGQPGLDVLPVLMGQA